MSEFSERVAFTLGKGSVLFIILFIYLSIFMYLLISIFLYYSFSLNSQWERNPEPLHRAASVLINKQMESGDFPQEVLEYWMSRNNVEPEMT